MKIRQSFRLVFALFLYCVAATAQSPKQELNDQMWEAARVGDAAMVATLLDKGADVNAKFRYGTTALFKAAERGNTDVVKVLLARGADVSVKDSFYGATAMTWALDNKHVEIVRLLLEKDAASVGDVLMTGARESNVDLVKLVLGRTDLKPEMLTVALAVAMEDKNNASVAEALKLAGAVPPLELDTATLKSYAGKYKGEPGPEVTLSVNSEGKLVAQPTGQRQLVLIALDKTTFRPIAIDGVTVVFTVEGDKATGFTLKQGQTTTQLKRVE